MNKNIFIFALTMITLGSIATYSAPSVLADWLIDRSGTIMKLDPMVLGDDDVKVEPVETPKPSETSKPTETSKTGTVNNVAEQQREQLKEQEELKRETAKISRERVREAAKQTLERKIKLNESKNRNIENKFELSAVGGELKIKQKTKSPDGVEKETRLELKENETLHVDQKDGESVDIDATSQGVLEITKDKFKGHTRLPISVNADNELVVTRPDGSDKVVTVLPDEAINKMSDNGVVVDSASVELTTNEAGDPVYEVKREVSKKLLGFIKMNFEAETTVSASDPNLIETTSTETSPWRKFLESLAR